MEYELVVRLTNIEAKLNHLIEKLAPLPPEQEQQEDKILEQK